MCSRNVTVPGGVFAQLRAGDTCSPAWVNLAGMTAPSGNAVEVNVIAGGGGPPARWPPWAAGWPVMIVIARAVVQNVNRMDRIAVASKPAADFDAAPFSGTRLR